MDDDFEPLLLEGDLPSLPDIHADDLLDWDLLTCESAMNGRKEYEFSDQVSIAISSPPLPSTRKTTEAWLIDQVGPIIEANACSPRNSLLFPKTFNGLIAKHALDAHMSEQNLSVTLTSTPNEGTTDTTDSHAQGAEKKSKKNQSRHGMTYSKKCEQCGEKKKKCKCRQFIDAGVVTLINNDSTPSESFEKKPEFFMYVSERGVTSRSPPLVTSTNWIDREIEEEKAELSKESSTEVSPRTWEEHDTSKELETEIDNESLWTDSMTVVRYEEDEKKSNGQQQRVDLTPMACETDNNNEST